MPNIWEDGRFKALSPQDKLVLLYLLAKSKMGLVKAQPEQIGSMTGLDTRQTAESLNRLIRNKFILHDGTTALILSEIADMPDDWADKIMSLASDFHESPLWGTFRRRLTEAVNKKIAIRKNILSSTPEGKSFTQKAIPVPKQEKEKKKREPKKEDDTLLDEFWAAYPRKEGRESFQEFFNSLRITKTKKQALVTAAKNYAEECAKTGRDIQYIFLPFNFLKHGKYKDYLATRKTSYRSDEDLKEIIGLE